MNTNNEEFRLNQILKSANNGISKEEILKLFAPEKREFIDFILENENNNNIIEVDGLFYHISNTEYRLGRYKDKKYNNKFVQIGNSCYTIEDAKLAVDEDLVLIKIIDKKRKIASIEKVIKREIHSIYGEVVQNKNGYFLKPESSKFSSLTINLNENENIIVGSKVVVELTNETEDNVYDGTITGIIGYSNDPGIDILMETYKYGIHPYFSSDSEMEAHNLPLEVRDVDKIGRCDLTKKQIFTIDGDDTKDIDDAVSLEILENGNYLLGVHITDVTHYIEKGSALDRDAYYKGTSLYLVGKVIPMYPAIISNGIGSLNPKQDRLTLTCNMEIDQNGKVVNYNIFESVINSNIQMTYKKVNDILNEGIIPFGYEEYIDTLKKMEKLSLILKKNRIKRGAFDIDRKELKIELDEKGFPDKFSIRTQDSAENLIEEFMIIANETVASALEEYAYPAMYRIHEDPSYCKVSEFIDTLNKIGMHFYGNGSDDIQRKLQQIAEELKKYGDVGKTMLQPFIRTLRKAKYSADNIGHSGLASEHYLHFTSPIRRYPDDIVHRCVKKYLLSDEYKNDILEQEKDYDELTEQAEYLSETEKNADRCELAILAMKCAEYMSKHIGEKYNGRIVQIDSKGLTIQLDNLIEGRVKINSLPCHYEYNDETLSLVSLDDTFEDYYYGDLVEVETVDANKENKTIEFVITKLLEQNQYIKPSINDEKRIEAITRSQKDVKRKTKRRSKWND